MATELPPYLSPSSLSTFEQCPLKYKYTRIDKLPEPPTTATLMGNFVHEVLENFYALEPSERTIPAVKQLSGQVWANSEWRERILPTMQSDYSVKSGKTSVDELINKFRWQSWFCIENIFTVEEPATISPSGIEHELNGKISGVSIKGFIDRWSETNDGLVISDYKTGKSPRKQYAFDKFMQLLIYGIVLGDEQQKPIDELQLIYLKDNQLLSMKPSTDDISKTKLRITNAWDGIVERCESGEWEPKPHRLCDWCNFKNTICPYWNNGDKR